VKTPHAVTDEIAARLEHLTHCREGYKQDERRCPFASILKSRFSAIRVDEM
jgi:hypothetical protein